MLETAHSVGIHGCGFKQEEKIVQSMKLLTAALLLSSPAFAQDSNTEGLYLGVGLGDFSADINDIDDVDEADLDFDRDTSARKIFAGWRMNRFVGVQLDVIDFGRSTAATNQLDVSTESDGIAPSIVGTLPLGPIELFLRGGILWYDVSIESDTDTFDDFDESDRDPVFGAGIGFTVAQRLNLRAEYEVVDIDALDDSRAVWITGAWRF